MKNRRDFAFDEKKICDCIFGTVYRWVIFVDSLVRMSTFPTVNNADLDLHGGDFSVSTMCVGDVYQTVGGQWIKKGEWWTL